MKTIITGLLTALVLLAPASAVAETQKADEPALFNLKVVSFNTPTLILDKPTEPPAPTHTVYTVVRGDSLSKIGTSYNVEWQRLWAKNKHIKHPDIIYVGDKITIPFPDEKLQRKLPAKVSLPKKTPGVVPSGTYTGGNTYDYGYCTWYVKNRRGTSLPNGLGNANTWYFMAKDMGLTVGSSPRPSAVGTTTAGALGHVVYVESVNKDGSINISEMNRKSWGVVSTRVASASEFSYIY